VATGTLAIAGLKVLVTGASSGIGAALARMLAEQGATVALVARREDKLRRVLEQCREHAPQSKMWLADLGDLALAEKIAGEAWDALGGLDVIVNNAAIPKVREVRRLSAGDLEETLRINLLSPVRIIQTLMPRMLERGSGTIVNVTSLGGRLGIMHESAYCASKFALTGFTESMYLDLHATPLRIRLVIPGPFETDIWDRPGSDPAVFKDAPKLPPEDCATGIIAAITGDAFEHYVPDMKAVAEFKTSNIEQFLLGVVAGAPRSD
jgi:short-subunit dehydrogenase